MQENTLLTRENMKALEYLVDFVSDSNSNNKDFENNNRELLDMYVELVKNSAFYTLDEKKQLIKKYGSRTLNQINVEDLAKNAKNMNIALDYLLNEKEDKQDFDKLLIYSEVFEILKNLEEEKINLIPNAIISTIKMMANPNPKAERKRVWIDSQTEEEIRRGIAEAKDNSEYDSLADSAYLRAKEDYLIGINFSRMLSIIYGRKLAKEINEEKASISVGRVMTCVLGMVVEREREIRNFKKTPYFKLEACFDGFKAEWRDSEKSRFHESSKLYNDSGFKSEEKVKE